MADKEDNPKTPHAIQWMTRTRWDTYAAVARTGSACGTVVWITAAFHLGKDEACLPTSAMTRLALLAVTSTMNHRYSSIMLQAEVHLGLLAWDSSDSKQWHGVRSALWKFNIFFKIILTSEFGTSA